MEAQPAPSGEWMLYHSCMRKNSADVARLLREGAWASCRDDDGRTPLHAAVRFGSAACVRELLRVGVCASFLDNGNESPLWLAVRGLDADIVSALLDYGCDPNQAHPDTGATVLALAVQLDTHHEYPIVSLLLEAGGDPRIKDSKGNTAYTVARDLRSASFRAVADAALESLLRRNS
ncbi:hypothetical protein DIPPA_34816 [Diplonema papillatum]|nr:hypothetical protein DIPPA_34816 [Diplonema papillatum]